MHCPNVLPRTATPPATYVVCPMIATSVMPGMRLTSAALRMPSALPLIVGARQTIVGSASGTSMSIANCFSAADDGGAVDAPLRRCR